MKSAPIIFLFFPVLSFALVMTACNGENSNKKPEESVTEMYSLKLNLRSQEQIPGQEEKWEVVQKEESWDPVKTAVVVTDMWDKHWCESAMERVAEMAPAMNEVLVQARNLGMLIIHSPSGTLDYYQESPQRQRAAEAAFHQAPEGIDLEQWCYLDPEKEDQLPIDDSDGGCDKPCGNGEPCVEGTAWTQQIEALKIHEGDVISDSGQEIYNVMMDNGVENIIIMGVHLNMCVLGRSFGIRQMARLGKNVVLVRDMTDTMYNPKMPPYVSHFEGTDLVIEHVEKFWAPTISSQDLTGKPAFNFKEDNREFHQAFASPKAGKERKK
jgi:nicotinamidase-related amidase